MTDKVPEQSTHQGERAAHLIELYINDRLTEGECDELSAILESRPNCKTFLRAQLDTHVLLQEMLASHSSENSVSGIMEWCALRAFATFEPAEKRKLTTNPIGESQAKSHPAIFFFKTVVVLLVFAVAGHAVFHEMFGSRPTLRSTVETFARISETIDVQWDEESIPFKPGAQIGAERIKFHAGIVKLEFKNGAELLLEGPAEFVVSGKRRTFCPYGKINAHVPKTAKGFEVSTPFTHVVDLGTEFSVVVENDRTDLHVLEGKVEAYRDRDDRIALAAGKAIRNLSNGTTEELALDRSACIDRSLFENLLAAFWKKRAEKRAERTARFVADPDLLCRFDGHDFYGPAQVKLSGGQAVRADGINGRAIRFRSARDAIGLDVPEQLDSLTLILRVKVHALEHVSRLMIGNEYYDKKGSILWQLDRTGEMQFHVHTGQERKFQAFDIPGAFRFHDLGTWTTLAVTVDGARREMKHFKDGRLLKRADWPEPVPLCIGQSTVGNENLDAAKRTARFLDGDLSELLIYRRALSDAEIENLYDDLL